MKTIAYALLTFLATTATPALAQSYAAAPASTAAMFGGAVAVGDGVVFVGEPENVMRPGTVYIYRPDADGQWLEAGRLQAPEAAPGDGFGQALAVRGNTLLVGQARETGGGRVHVFDRRGDQWRHAGQLVADTLPEEAAFGAALALGENTAVVGAPGADGMGRAYVFRRDRRDWRQTAVLRASDADDDDAFAASLALDGDRLLVGAPGRSRAAGVAYLFHYDGGDGWTQEARLGGRGVSQRSAFGLAVALAGDTAFVAAPGFSDVRGAVFEFGREAGGEWQERGRVVPSDSARNLRFGYAVVYRDGAMYVGAPGAAPSGAVYVMQRTGPGEWAEADTMTVEAVERGADFGSTLAVGTDVVVAGALGEDHGAGSAVIMGRDGGRWRVAAKVASEPEGYAAVAGGEVRCEGGSASHWDCTDVDLQSFLPVSDIGGGRGVRLNDVWGWTDPETRREYALVGRIDGTSFVDVTDPQNPRYLGDLPMTEGSNAATWRDIKVYRNHAYVVADGAGQHGVQVFDLTRLRDVAEPRTFDEDALYDRVASVHNIVVDTASGFAFAVGSRAGGETCGGGLHMIDIREPQEPTFAGCFADPQTGRASTGYTHDAQCVVYEGPDEQYRGREICFGANETMLSIADVTDKDDPVALSRAGYPNVGYTHQGWLTEDQRFFYMNDELDELQGLVPYTRTLIWDVSELDDPQLVGEFMGTTRASDHNLYIRGNLMYQSNYQAGLRVIDITDREDPREVGYFDTVPYGENAPGFGGSWSNYPFFPSGTILVTSGREGLFVLRKRGPVS